MPNVLITGGAGFIGGFVAEAFAERGDRVHLVDNLARGRRDGFLEALLERRNVELIECDLRQHDALGALGRDYTHIFHLAAILGVANVLEHPDAVLSDNVSLLTTVLQFAREQSQLERFLFASTSEVYAGSLEHMDMPVPTPESMPLAIPDITRPRTSYMLSKVYGEAMVAQARLPHTIVRPHNIFGPRMGQLHVVPQLLEKAHRGRDGEPFEVFSVDHSRTFCFIEDAVKLFVAASLTPECEGQTLNLGNEAPEVRIGELARIVLSVTGREMPISPMPATAGSPVRRAPDMSRMLELTGLAASIPLAEGVARTYEWYSEHVFNGAETEVAR